MFSKNHYKIKKFSLLSVSITHISSTDKQTDWSENVGHELSMKKWKKLWIKQILSKYGGNVLKQKVLDANTCTDGVDFKNKYAYET